MVKVSIKRDEVTKEIVIESPGTLPSPQAVVAQMDKGIQRKLKRRLDYGYDLATLISRHEDTISFQVWTDAISQAILVQTLNAEGASTEMNFVGQGAYLALGDAIYRLNPVEMVSQSKAIALAKKLAVEGAKRAAHAYTESAKVSVAALLADAQAKRREATQFLEEAKKIGSEPPPRWALPNDNEYEGLTLKFESGMWQVATNFKYRVTHFDVNFVSDSGSESFKYSWEAIPVIKRATIWVPLQKDGTYSVTAMYLMKGQPLMPHINHEATCLSLGDNPPKIQSRDHLRLLSQSLTRACSRVQLNDLRTALSDWIEHFKDTMPPELYMALAANMNWSGAVALAKTLNPTPVNAEKEESESWKVGAIHAG